MVSIVDAHAPFPTRIRRLLKANTIMSLKQLRHALNGRPRSSLFRDLKNVDVISSYSHTGQYHALKSMAAFNQQGLWFFNEIGFSSSGTLKATLTQLISESETGMTQRELKNLLRVSVQNTLTHLLKSNAVGRQLLDDRLYLYVSQEREKADDQLQRRRRLQERVADTALPPESIRIEILLEVIRSPRRAAEAKDLGRALRRRGIAIRDDDVAGVLIYYDIKKNGL